MEKLLIMAYMGTGKTELENKYDNVIDFDFQDYKYIYDESKEGFNKFKNGKS